MATSKGGRKSGVDRASKVEAKQNSVAVSSTMQRKAMSIFDDLPSELRCARTWVRWSIYSTPKEVRPGSLPGWSSTEIRRGKTHLAAYQFLKPQDGAARKQGFEDVLSVLCVGICDLGDG